MQKKDTESSDAARQLAVEMLKNINVRVSNAAGAVTVPQDVDGALDTILTKRKVSIPDTELVEDDASD
jgi:hypothetical protein